MGAYLTDIPNLYLLFSYIPYLGRFGVCLAAAWWHACCYFSGGRHAMPATMHTYLWGGREEPDFSLPMHAHLPHLYPNTPMLPLHPSPAPTTSWWLKPPSHSVVGNRHLPIPLSSTAESNPSCLWDRLYSLMSSPFAWPSPEQDLTCPLWHFYRKRHTHTQNMHTRTFWRDRHIA